MFYVLLYVPRVGHKNALVAKCQPLAYKPWQLTAWQTPPAQGNKSNSVRQYRLWQHYYNRLRRVSHPYYVMYSSPFFSAWKVKMALLQRHSRLLACDLNPLRKIMANSYCEPDQKEDGTTTATLSNAGAPCPHHTHMIAT